MEERYAVDDVLVAIQPLVQVIGTNRLGPCCVIRSLSSFTGNDSWSQALMTFLSLRPAPKRSATIREGMRDDRQEGFGWEEHAPNRGELGTAGISGGFQASRYEPGMHTVLSARFPLCPIFPRGVNSSHVSTLGSSRPGSQGQAARASPSGGEA